ncbi:ricin-type beta-trefoil lectin domain protein [Actinoplanes bogorensis]|uniref:Ricin-type beta-trefoil lectin domain protein n=1 Tax=Paractinoplanes bogorensis TaxID=1610840 RepID=A0ABS5YRC4_9ACTN|nr:glycoside hydrolase family protein [Actinoplanes bogorensis]MBU2666002.1 ricin-type beta-trefoil lectin domain protein [Actinoplanes bogorensis]
MSRKTLAIAVSGVVVAGLGVLGVTTALAATAGPITGSTGKCVDVAGANSANGTAVQMWDCNGTAAQQWTVDGKAVKALGKCLDVAAASRADGARVQIYDCNGTGAQQWTASNGRLINSGSGKCLDADGARLQIWACHGGTNQVFRLAGAPAPTTPPPATTPPATTPPATSVAKKGVSTWQFNGLSGAMSDVGAKWYYNWGTNNDSMPANAEFVPMIWDENVVTAANLAKVKTEGKTLLGFNEPDLAGQAEMTVEQALDLWPQLQATGMRLGAPAVAFGGDTPGGWLDRFMTGAKARGLRVDFIPLHWYGSDFSSAATGQFMGYVKAVHDRYKLPIWVTEYGLMNFSGTPRYPSTAQITSFITTSTQQLEAASYVERYAWFSLPAVADSVDYGLYRDATTPTEAGKAYRAAGR